MKEVDKSETLGPARGAVGYHVAISDLTILGEESVKLLGCDSPWEITHGDLAVRRINLRLSEDLASYAGVAGGGGEEKGDETLARE